MSSEIIIFKSDAVIYEFDLIRLKNLKSKFKIMTQLTQ